MARTLRPRLVSWERSRSASATIGLSLAILASLPAAAAKAWTEARVTTAAATLVVDGSGATDVDLELGIGIDAGWLEGLEIAGLDPDLVLDPAHVVVLVSEERERFTPAVRPLGEGRVLLSFARRDAPRRGRYRTRLRYHTEIGGRTTTPTGQGTVRFEWTLPGWQSGLDGVSIQIVAPRGATLPPEQTSAQSTQRADVRESADGTLLTFRRAHLPRTVPWTVAFEVPEASVVPSLRGPRAHAELPPRPVPPPPREPELPRSTELLVALFAAAALLKRALYGRAVRARGAKPRPLAPFPAWAHALVVLGCAAASIALGRRGFELYPLPLFAILLLAVERPVAHAAPRLGAFRPVSKAHFVAARRAFALSLVEPLRFLDVTRPAGFATTAVALATLAGTSDGAESEHAFTTMHGAVLFVALMATSPASRLPSTPELRLHDLVQLAERFRAPVGDGAPSMALRLLVHEDADGRLQDARLRICTPSRPDGLVRFDVVRLERDGLGGHRAGHALLVVTRAGSAAERIVAAARPRLAVQRAPAGRRARLGSVATDLEPLLRALASSEVERAAPTPERRAGVSRAPSPVAEARLAS